MSYADVPNATPFARYKGIVRSQRFAADKINVYELVARAE